MMNRLIALCLTVLTFAFFVSCTPDQTYDDTLVLIDNGKSEYSVIVGAGASDAIVQAGIDIVRAAERVSGAKLDFGLDRYKKPDKNGFEIIIGETNRVDFADIKPTKKQDYVIAASGNSVLICGGSDDSTIAATRYFVENIVTGGEVFLASDFVYRHEYEDTKIILNGMRVTGFHLSADDDLVLDGLEEALFDVCGLKLDGPIELRFEIDETIEEKTLKMTERRGALVISSASEFGLEAVDDVIYGELERLNKLELSNGESAEFVYKVPDVSELVHMGECYILGETDKSPLEYEVGEEMVFTLSVYCDGEKTSAPGFYYTVEKDYADTVERVTVGNVGDTLEIRTSLDRPGFVKIYAAATSENGAEIKGVTPFNGGAAAGFESITRSYDEPLDFDEFWQGHIATLDEVLPEATIVNDLSEDYPGFRVYDIMIDAPITPVTGYLSVPEGVGPASLPILVGFMDYGVFSISPSVKENTIVFVTNPHSIENGREDAYYDSFSTSRLYSYGFSRRENANPDTVYFKNMILRDLQALRYLKGLEEWDGENIEVNGGGQGAYQALAVAAFDKSVSYVYAAYPWLCDLAGYVGGRIKGWYPDYSEALAYYDAVSFAERVECELEIVAGLGDYVSPPSGVAALANNLNIPANIIFYQGVTHKYIPKNVLGYQVIFE